MLPTATITRLTAQCRTSAITKSPGLASVNLRFCRESSGQKTSSKIRRPVAFARWSAQSVNVVRSGSNNSLRRFNHEAVALSLQQPCQPGRVHARRDTPRRCPRGHARGQPLRDHRRGWQSQARILRKGGGSPMTRILLALALLTSGCASFHHYNPNDYEPCWYIEDGKQVWVSCLKKGAKP